jgi:hypothetical protein
MYKQNKCPHAVKHTLIPVQCLSWLSLDDKRSDLQDIAGTVAISLVILWTALDPHDATSTELR